MHSPASAIAVSVSNDN